MGDVSATCSKPDEANHDVTISLTCPGQDSISTSDKKNVSLQFQVSKDMSGRICSCDAWLGEPDKLTASTKLIVYGKLMF